MNHRISRGARAALLGLGDLAGLVVFTLAKALPVPVLAGAR